MDPILAIFLFFFKISPYEIIEIKFDGGQIIIDKLKRISTSLNFSFAISLGEIKKNMKI